MKRRALERLAAFEEAAGRASANLVLDNGNRQRGVIVGGRSPSLSLMDALDYRRPKARRAQAGRRLSPADKARRWPFLPRTTRSRWSRSSTPSWRRSSRPWRTTRGSCAHPGQGGHRRAHGRMQPAKARDILDATWPDLFAAPRPRALPTVSAPRPPQMCPGCGHRSAFYAIKKALRAG